MRATSLTAVARAKLARLRRYYALTVPGIEDMAADELRRAGASSIETLSRFDKRDSIVLFEAESAAAALRCGLTEDVFAVVLDVPAPIGRGAPQVLARGIDRIVLEAAMLEHHEIAATKRGRSYKVIARVAGRKPFRRQDVEEAFGRAIGRLLSHWVNTRGHAAIEVWAHIVGERAVVGLRLSGDELAQRRWKRAHLPASLKPTVARALVELSQPRDGDVFVDPMCGAGTIVRERAEMGRARIIAGGDVDAAAIAASRENVGRAAALMQWDATRLPLRNASVDAIVVNPPYGRQHGEGRDIGELYRAAMLEARRVLRRSGRCVVLTGEPEALLRATPRDLRVKEQRRLLVRGLPVTAFVMVRE